MVRRITYVVHQFLPRYFTGTEQYVFGVAREMQRRGHDVEVIALEPDFSERIPFFEWREEEVAGLRVQRIRHWMLLDRSFARMEYAHPFVAERVRRHLERRRPDVLHAFHLRHVGADVLAESRALSIPTVVHLMDFWFLCPAITLMRRDGALCEGPPEGGLGCAGCVDASLGVELEHHALHEPLTRVAEPLPDWTAPSPTTAGRARTFMERPAFLRGMLLLSDRIVAPSRFLRETFVQNGYPRERIDVLGYGVDPGRLGPVAPRADREAGEPLRCGFFGTIAPHKGADVAVEAVRRAGEGVTLTVRGRTTDFAAFSQPLVDRVRGEPRIRFEGAFARDELGAALAAIDVLLVPSRWYENTPFVVLEAFAAGVPVLASALGGLTELVEDGVHGELFSPGDADDLARRLVRLRDEPQRLAEYRARLPRVKTLSDNVDEIESLYGALWSGERSPSTMPPPV